MNQPHQTPPALSLTLVLSLWLAWQLIALLLSAARIPLSAHFVQPADKLAVDEMLVAQFTGTAIFLPLLFGSTTTFVAAVLTCAPMLGLTLALSPISWTAAFILWLFLACWMTSLFLWRIALPAKFQKLLVALASVVTIGGLLAWYFRCEFVAPVAGVCFGPAAAAIAIARNQTSAGFAWLWPAIPAMIALPVVASRRAPR